MYLIARISTDGRDCVELLARDHQPVGDARFADVQALLAKHGYEMTSTHRVKRSEWPFVVVAYKSPNREGVGRAGGQFHTWPARKVPNAV